MGRIISTKDVSFPRYWFVTIDSFIPKLPETSYTYVWNFINDTLNDSKSWKRFGYNFVAIDPIKGLELRKEKKVQVNVFHIRLSLNNTIVKECNLPGLSCADSSVNIIFLNVDNWVFGTVQSGMDCTLYRKYVILHEIGHLLGRGHKKCMKNKNDYCSIMYQQTISKGCCTPNVYPLDDD
jgi:hypothetical protein